MAKRKKIAFIGAGNVGATCAHLCFLRGLGDIVLYDIIDGLPQGKALDMLESAPVLGIDVNVTGTTDIKQIEGADCVRRHLGIAAQTRHEPRRPAQDQREGDDRRRQRDQGSMRPGAFVIAVTNPLDAMVTQLKRVTGFAKGRIVGQAGVLDSARYRTFLASELGVSAESVSAMVLGGHGDDMVPMRSYTTVRRPADRTADRGEAARRNREAHARRRRRNRRADEDLVVLRGGHRGLQNGRGVHARSQAGAAVRRVSRRRVRREGAVCGSAGRNRLRAASSASLRSS